jgi:hypothetical protein
MADQGKPVPITGPSPSPSQDVEMSGAAGATSPTKSMKESLGISDEAAQKEREKTAYVSNIHSPAMHLQLTTTAVTFLPTTSLVSIFRLRLHQPRRQKKSTLTQSRSRLPIWVTHVGLAITSQTTFRHDSTDHQKLSSDQSGVLAQMFGAWLAW